METPANHRFGHIVCTYRYTPLHTVDRDVRVRQAQLKNFDEAASIAPLRDQA